MKKGMILGTILFIFGWNHSVSAQRPAMQGAERPDAKGAQRDAQGRLRSFGENSQNHPPRPINAYYYGGPEYSYAPNTSYPYGTPTYHYPPETYNPYGYEQYSYAPQAYRQTYNTPNPYTVPEQPLYPYTVPYQYPMR